MEVPAFLQRREIQIGLAVGGIAGLVVLATSKKPATSGSATPTGDAAFASSVNMLQNELSEVQQQSAADKASFLDTLAGFFDQQQGAFAQYATQAQTSIDQSNTSLSAMIGTQLNTLGQDVDNSLAALGTQFTQDIQSNIASAVNLIRQNTNTALRQQTQRENRQRIAREERAEREAARAAAALAQQAAV